MKATFFSRGFEAADEVSFPCAAAVGAVSCGSCGLAGLTSNESSIDAIAAEDPPPYLLAAMPPPAPVCRLVDRSAISVRRSEMGVFAFGAGVAVAADNDGENEPPPRESRVDAGVAGSAADDDDPSDGGSRRADWGIGAARSTACSRASSRSFVADRSSTGSGFCWS
jgi:hypothetical protein